MFDVRPKRGGCRDAEDEQLARELELEDLRTQLDNYAREGAMDAENDDVDLFAEVADRDAQDLQCKVEPVRNALRKVR